MEPNNGTVNNKKFVPAYKKVNLGKTRFIKHEIESLDPLDPKSYEYLVSPVDKRLRTRRFMKKLPDY